MHSTEQLHKDKAKQSQSDAAKAEKKDQPKKEDPLKKKDAEIDELKKKKLKSYEEVPTDLIEFFILWKK